MNLVIVNYKTTLQLRGLYWGWVVGVLFLIVNKIININFGCVELLMSLNELTFIYRPFSISCLHVYQRNCKVVVVLMFLVSLDNNKNIWCVSTRKNV